MQRKRLWSVKSKNGWMPVERYVCSRNYRTLKFYNLILSLFQKRKMLAEQAIKNAREVEKAYGAVVDSEGARPQRMLVFLYLS